MNRVSRGPATEAAEALLEAGRTQPVLDYDVDLGLARHQHWLRNDAPMPEWASTGLGAVTTTKSSLAALALKTIVSTLLVGVLAIAAWNVRDRLQPSATSVPRAAEPAPAAAPVVLEDVAVAETAAAPKPIPITEQSLPSERVARRAATDKRATRGQRSHKEHAAAPASAAPVPVETALAAAPAAPMPSPSVNVAPREAAPAPEPKRKPRPEPGAKAQGPDDLLEMQEVARAEQLLEGSPERALTLVRQGDQRFAHGYFQQERAYVAIMALIRLGRVEEARSRAATFAKRFPALPYGARIRSALQASGAANEKNR
jgi:hypothetical protein